jgi:hypothetical protein
MTGYDDHGQGSSTACPHATGTLTQHCAEAERLAREVERLRAVLREVEWDNPVHGARYCPSCVEPVQRGHAPACRLAAALKGGA